MIISKVLSKRLSAVFQIFNGVWENMKELGNSTKPCNRFENKVECYNLEHC